MNKWNTIIVNLCFFLFGIWGGIAICTFIISDNPPTRTTHDQDPEETEISEIIILRNLTLAQKKLIEVLDDGTASGAWAIIDDTLHLPVYIDWIGLCYIRCAPDGCDVIILDDSIATGVVYTNPYIAIDEMRNIAITAIMWTLDGYPDLVSWHLPYECYGDYDYLINWVRYINVDGGGDNYE